MSKQFNNKLFRNFIAYQAKTQKEFKEHYIAKRQDMYDILSDLCGVEPDTVRSWTKPNKAPNPYSLEKLEEALGVNPGFFTISDDKENFRTNTNNKENREMISDFTKNYIMTLNQSMREYFKDLDISDEEKYCALEDSVDDIRIALPTGIYEAAKNYIHSHLSDFVTDTKEQDAKNDSAYYDYLKNLLTAAELWEKIATEQLLPYLN